MKSIRLGAGVRGFTLIELLVVIAIISLLSAVVLASLNSARDKAKTAAIESGVLEFRKLMELEYSETGSYAALQRTWVNSVAACSTIGYSGNYASQAVSICKAIQGNTTYTSNVFHTGNSQSNINKYSIMARLPNGKYFCAGSSGVTSDTEPVSGTSAWSQPGCYANP